mgnify:CR=1 FL=1
MFTHLHVHSEFSILESSIKIRELIETVVKLGMKSVALTDKYVMSGAVEFYKKTMEQNIKPIIGCEVCLSIRYGEYQTKNLTLSSRNSSNHDQERLSHLTLLVKNEKGYENLCQLVSKSHTENIPVENTRHYQKSLYLKPQKLQALYLPFKIPVLKIEELKNFPEGLICLSGCSKGEISQLLRTKDVKEAEEFAKILYEIFGQDFYIEIQRYRLTNYNSNKNLSSENLINFARKTNIPIVATNNVHYLTRNDYSVYRYLSKIKLMGIKYDPTASTLEGDENYLKSEREMARMFYDIPQAITNTRKIAESCNFNFCLGRITLPHFTVPAGESQENYLKKLCEDGLRFRYGSSPPPHIKERLSKELEVINKTGFAVYFLVVADIARFACENKIPICGKGSAAGSLVSYILRISNVDPIKNNLCFERFLNEERKKPPDIDIDISNKDREKVWQYLCSKYGKESIARVASFATTRPRASIREAGRILGVARDEIDYIIKSVPDYNRFFTTEKMQQSAESSNLIDSKNTHYRKITSISARISGYIRHVSTHPSALIVSNYNLSKKIPLTLSETGEITSQYDMNSIEDIGIMKIDLINSLSLCLITDTVEKLKKSRSISLDISRIRCNDRDVFSMLQNGKTLGVFQLESFGIRTLSRKIKPACLNDITLLVSLYRPGPQQSGMVDNFIERKFGREKITYIHRDLEPILKETYGVILYQEQVMAIAIKIAGYCLSEADSLRKAMTRLSKEEMLAHHSKFLKGALKKGYERHTAEEIFALISKFASYGFVKAHAAAYAEISYKTCFLKAHYPAEFLSTILTNNSGYYSKMQYMEEARRLGVNLKLPDINKSGFDFSVEDNGKSIRVPLTSVRSLGFAAANSIIYERKRNGNFINFFNFYRRIAGNCSRITKNAVENLIKVGAFDFTGISRKQLLLDFYCLRNHRKPASYYCKKNKYPSFIIEPFLENQGPNKKMERSEYCRTDFTAEEKLEIEVEVLGFYVSCHPLNHFKKELKKSGSFPYDITQSGLFYQKAYQPYQSNSHNARTISDAGQRDIFTAGMVLSKRIEKTKDNKNMMFCTMEDEDGMYEAVFFPDAYCRNIKIIAASLFLILRGRLHLKDNNVSIIVKDVISVEAVKKIKRIQNEENIKAELLSKTENLWSTVK